jgi:membrane protein YqaA with SNARE-associated domain
MFLTFDKLKHNSKFLPLIFLLCFSLFLYFFGGADYMVELVGIKNAYLLMFFVALLGGLTTFNTVPYYSLLFLLASAGLDPLYLGLASAFGVMRGDTFSYFLGRQGAAIIPIKFQNFFNKLKTLAENNEKLFMLACFVYGSVSPLSNDFISLSAGMARIKYWKVMLPLGLGNIVFNVSFAYLCIYGSSFLNIF